MQSDPSAHDPETHRDPGTTRWPTPEESVAAAAGLHAPEIDGPPRRTSSRTPLVVVAGALPFVLLALLGILIAIPIAAVILVRGILQWWFRTYTLGRTQLVIDQGIFTRRRQVVPYDRVQQVDTRRGVVSQLLGVSELRVATAAGAGSEDARLQYLEAELAEGLRAYILQRREELQGADATTAPRDDGGAMGPPSVAGSESRTLLELSPSRLALASVTHSSILVGAAGGLFVGLWIGAFIGFGTHVRPVVLLGGGLAAGALVAAFSTFVVIVRNLVERYGFAVALRGDDIQLRYGLLEVRSLTVPRRRVQQVGIVDNPVRRRLGLVSLELHSASAGGDVTSFEIPLLPRAELETLLVRLMGSDTWIPPEATPRSARARARGIRRRCILLALGLAPPAIMLFPAGLGLFALALAGIPWGRVAHQRAGHGVSDTLVMVRHGVFRHHVDLVPLARVQSCRTYASPFQRRARLVTFFVDVAGGAAPRLYDMDRTTADELLADLPRRSTSRTAIPAP